LPAIDSSDNAGIAVFLNVGDCEVGIVINSQGKLHSLDLISPDYSWINSEKILLDASQYAAPNDLRTAVFYLLSSQQSQELIQRDITSLKKYSLISVVSPYVFKSTFKNGMSLLVEASPYYSKVLRISCLSFSLPSFRCCSFDR
jgi:hypothetical protein